MPTQAEITLMKRRKRAAGSAIKFFTDVKEVRSANNPFDMLSKTAKDDFYRLRGMTQNTIVGTFRVTAHTGMGNCDEKGRICYAALSCNPLLLNTSEVTLCSAVGYDHVFVIVSDGAINGQVFLSTLGVTAMVVDGWTQDWYFPNLGYITRISQGLGKIPNPRQLYVRGQIEKHKLEYYGFVPDM